MLAERFTDQLADHLLSRDDYHPFPTAEERAPWDALPAAARAAHIARAEEVLGYAWPALPATLYLEFPRIGNRENFEQPHFDRRNTLATLVLGECMAGEGRFLDDIVNGIWAICEESSWCLPAHIRRQQAGNTLPDTTEPVVDLFAAETSDLLAWTFYLLGPQLDAVSPVVGPRIEREITDRVLTPCLERDDFHWMGFFERDRPVNNWNPWICSNWLASILLIEPDPLRRQTGVAKQLRTLDNFIDPYPRDGGCDEGPNYWGRAGASLFDNLELLRDATGGWIDLYSDPLVGEIGRFIYRAHINGDFYLNFADASAIVYPEPMLVYRYGQRIVDQAMVDYGRWAAADQEMLDEGIVQGTGRVPASLLRALPDLFKLQEAFVAPGKPPLLRDVWLDEIQVMAARDRAGSAAGFYVAAKGGHNAESHNHNDIGNFVVYINGKPVLVDGGVETYTAKTFSDRRYEIWTMQSAYHSLLPTIDGVQQAPGKQFAARDVRYTADEERVDFSLDMAAAYPPEANIRTWRRTVALQRGEGVEVSDEFTLSQPAREIVATLLTPCAVELGNTAIRLTEATFGDDHVAGSAVVEYDAGRFTVEMETIPISDARMGAVWGTQLTRIVFRRAEPAVRETWVWRVQRVSG